MIRNFKNSDLSSIMQIWLTSNTEVHNFVPEKYWTDHVEMVKEMLPQAEIYVSENENIQQIDGFIGVNEDYIEGIFVKKSMRSKGIGKQLLDYVEKIKSQISLSVYQKNKKAISFYQREHFTMEGEGMDDDTGEKDFFMIWRRKRNTPVLETERLILRKFTEEDMNALFLILKDEEANQFLPWYPVKNLEETKSFFEERYASRYAQPQAYAYAICRKEDNVPIGYMNVATEESHDFGYGIRREYWHQGIATEAGKAVVEQVKKDGLPYITATHDQNNPRSEKVMQKLGMKYCYSYEEQWQPKDFLVIFRMYQLNFTADDDFVYKKYWNESENHFIEKM